MKKRLLLIIIALLALASGAQAATVSEKNILIEDGDDIRWGFNEYLAIIQVLANVEGKWNSEVTSENVYTYKDLSGNMLFSIDAKSKVFNVPVGSQPFEMKVTLSAASKEALKSVIYTEYDKVKVSLQQKVNEKTFPNNHFREWVINNVCPHPDYLPDPIEILRAEDVEKVYFMDVNNKSISSLKGIEYFTNLVTLDCGKNRITSLDLSKNKILTKLHCQNNKLTSLKVYSNSLDEIDCSGNNISGSNMDALIRSLPTLDGTLVVKLPGNTTSDNLMTCKQVSDAKRKGWIPKVAGTGADYLGSDFVCSINSTNFPDGNFRNYISNTIDTDKNGMLDQSEIAATTQIDVSGKSIGSLTGISYFKELVTLYCSSNNLTTLDLSSNTSLNGVYCRNNQLTTLRVSGLAKLQAIDCSSNKLTSLNLSTCKILRYLNCSGNQLTSLTMQGSSASLTAPVVYCNGNKLRGSAMTSFVNSLPKASSNDGYLYVMRSEASTGNSITSDDVKSATNRGYDVKIWDSSKQAWVSHPDSHPGLYTINIYDGVTLGITDAQVLDDIFTYCSQFGVLLYSLSGDVYTIYASNVNMEYYKFTYNKKTWKCNQIANSTFATDYYIYPYTYVMMLPQYNGILKQYPGIELRVEVAINSTIFPDTNFLTWVSNNCDTDNNGRLSKSELESVTSMDVSNKNISNLKGIEHFWWLTSLNCSGNNLTSLDLAWQASLTTLNCSGNKLQSLDISQCKALEYLYCNNNQLTSLSLSNNTALKNLQCQNNLLSSLSVTNNTALVRIMCYGNKIQGTNMTSFINSLPKKSDGRLNVYANNSSEGNRISVAQVKVAKEDKGWQVLTSGENPYPGYDALAVNDTNFPDATFKSWVSSNCDIDKDGFLSDEEIAAVTSIDVCNKNISNLKGIEYFTALTYLDCSLNQLTSLDVSKNTALTYLSCICFQLTSLDVSKNTALTELSCGNNQLTSLNVSNNTALRRLYCDNNQLTSLNVSNNTALTSLYCSNNQLTSLDVSKNTELINLYCSDNLLTSLDVKGLYLERLDCGNNQLTSLDLTSATQLEELDCSDNQLTALVATDCSELKELICYNNKIKGSAFYLPYISGDSGEQGRLEFNSDPSDDNMWIPLPADGNVLTTTKVLRLKNDGWNVLTKIGERSHEEYLGVGGDANFNWVIDEDDVDTMRDYILGSDPSPFSLKDADVNGDGTVDIVDLTLLIQYLTK